MEVGERFVGLASAASAPLFFFVLPRLDGACPSQCAAAWLMVAKLICFVWLVVA